VNLFRNRPLEGPYPYLWLDATYLKIRSNHRVVSKALVISSRRQDDRRTRDPGLRHRSVRERAILARISQGSISRGLSGVQLVISDAHEGLKKAIQRALLGASWQRCTVHFMRNALAHVPRGAQQMVAAYIRTIFAQPDQATAKAQLWQVAATLEERFPKVAQMLTACEDEFSRTWRSRKSTTNRFTRPTLLRG